MISIQPVLLTFALMLLSGSSRSLEEPETIGGAVAGTPAETKVKAAEPEVAPSPSVHRCTPPTDGMRTSFGNKRDIAPLSPIFLAAAARRARPPERIVVPSPPLPPESSSLESGFTTALLPMGTAIEVRLSERLGSRTNRSGERFEALLDRALELEGGVTIPYGSLVVGKILEAQPSGRVKGRALLSISLSRIEFEDALHFIRTSAVVFEAGTTKNRDAATVAIATGVGALLGALFGGKEAVAKGAAWGAGAGGAEILRNRGKEVELDREQKISFRLEKELKLQLPR